MTVEVILKGAGAPSKYNPSYCERVLKVAEQGGHIPAMMREIGIKSKDTWYRWQKDYPEFKDAVEQAEVVSQAFYEELGLRGILGSIPNFNASTYALIMNNKFSKEYKRNPSSTEVNITNNTLNLTPEQLDLKIAQTTEKLKSLGVEIERTS